MRLRRHYLVICEGASEFAYVQELGRFLSENDIPLALSAHNVESGNFKTIRRYCRKFIKGKKNDALVMLDYDIYFRNENGNKDLYRDNKDKLPLFCFQHFNFEDFLLMHYPADLLAHWRAHMEPSKHFSTPLSGEIYLKEFRQFVAANEEELEFVVPYHKGDMPFVLTKEKLRNLFANNTPDALPKSGFATFLQKQIPL